jgi:catechol 2,3-dioxygenase-like lactoylglutathione lyase family enzyme
MGVFAMKPFVRLDHVTLMVKDLETSIKFYTEKLGFSVHGETPAEDGRKTVFLRSGNACFDLYGMTEETPPSRSRLEDEVGLVHIALKVEDFDETYNELVRRGVRFHIKPFYQPRSGRRIAFFRDPDGNVLHITDGKA